MRFKSSLIALSLSLVCFIPRAALADSITLTTTTGGSTDGIDIYPYVFDVTGSGGATSQNISMSCLNFNREVSIGESWDVNAVAVSSIGNGGLDYETQQAFIEDAWLYNQYAGATTTQEISDIQFAIWYVMDPSAAVTSESGYTSGYSTSSASLDAQALAEYNSGTWGFDANDVVLVPISADYPSEQNEPQIFMVDPMPPAMTPEPASLVLLGTGFLGAVFTMRRKLRTV
ncbi:MAG: PEP-CTERM sorting domain-containing protein [Acidobacteriaceae bacterium]|jgi:hypothetical protein